MGLQSHFLEFLSLQMTLPKRKLTKIKRNPMLNNYEQQLNHPICENIDEKENDKEDNLTYKENITQQDIGDKKKSRKYNI